MKKGCAAFALLIGLSTPARADIPVSMFLPRYEAAQSKSADPKLVKQMRAHLAEAENSYLARWTRGQVRDVCNSYNRPLTRGQLLNFLRSLPPPQRMMGLNAAYHAAMRKTFPCW